MTRTKLLFLFLSLTLWIFSCSSPSGQPETNSLQPGTYRAVVSLQGQELPFTLDIQQPDSGQYRAYLVNASERLEINNLEISGDSVTIPMHIFDTRVVAAIEGNTLNGYWVKNYDTDYKLPFSAERGSTYRFAQNKDIKASENVEGRWLLQFADSDDEAIGEFKQEGNKVTGTILTTTGDYRFLEGNLMDDRLYLSTFDGEHAYVFEATINGDELTDGHFWSGKTYHTTFSGKADPNATLPDANELTYIKEGYDGMSFTFPNPSGDSVSLSDPKYQGKVIIVQLFGTWCPNCMDETKFYTGWYEENKDRGVEIIGLSYERKDDFDYASRRVNTMKEKLDVGYDFLIAGVGDKEKAAKTLPMLNHVMSFPTSIFIDRKGNVRNIHTGFSGPGTGKYYTQYVEEFNLLMDKLLAEPVPGKYAG
jgi:thiol-disulfide isomerase/thioredoxin